VRYQKNSYGFKNLLSLSFSQTSKQEIQAKLLLLVSSHWRTSRGAEGATVKQYFFRVIAKFLGQKTAANSEKIMFIKRQNRIHFV